MKPPWKILQNIVTREYEIFDADGRLMCGTFKLDAAQEIVRDVNDRLMKDTIARDPASTKAERGRE